MSYYRYIALVFFGLPAFLYADDWLGLEREGYSMGLRVGIDQEGESLIGIDSSLPLPKYSQLLLNYSVAEPSDNEFSLDLENYSVFFASDPLASWAFDIGYQYRGDTQLIEIHDAELGLQYFPGSWLIKIGYLSGKVEVFLRNNSDSSAESEREAYRLSIDKYWDQVSISLFLTDYDYEVDLSRLDNFFQSIFRSNNIRTIRTLNFGVIDQVFNLPDWEWSGEFTYSMEKAYWRIGYQQYESAVDNNQIENVYAGVSVDLDKLWQLGFLLDRSLEDSSVYSEVSLRVSW